MKNAHTYRIRIESQCDGEMTSAEATFTGGDGRVTSARALGASLAHAFLAMTEWDVPPREEALWAFLEQVGHRIESKSLRTLIDAHERAALPAAAFDALVKIKIDAARASAAGAIGRGTT